MIRMNFGCGSVQPEGWVNVDKDSHGFAQSWPTGGPGFYQEDIRDGLLWTEDHFDYIVAHHSLSDLTHHELGPALQALHRVLKPGGVLRVSVPDLLAARAAWERWDPDWFPQGPEMRDIDDRFCTYVTWFGTAGSVYTPRYLRNLLVRAGFSEVSAAKCGESPFGLAHLGICDLDARCGESLIYEGRK